LVRGKTHRQVRFDVRLRRVLIGFSVAALVAAGAGVAAEEPRAASDSGRGRVGGLRLDRERLAPRVSIQLESFSSFRRVAGPGMGLRDHVLFDELTESVRRGAKSVTRKALRNYLLEAVNLDRGIDRLRSEIRGERRATRDVDFHVGFHHMLPEVGVRYRLGSRSLRFSVGADGDVGVRLTTDRFANADVAVGFDGNDEFRIRTRFSF
jgi:hypothetical protein